MKRTTWLQRRREQPFAAGGRLDGARIGVSNLASVGLEGPRPDPAGR
ncbi:MAG: hypothetical protein ACKO7Z_05740 [Cyanobacteriota bacterium]